MNVNKFLKRVKKRKSGIKKYEKMSVDFHNKVRKGFLKIAQKIKKRCVVINAEMNKIEIKEKIINIINKKFKTNF